MILPFAISDDTEESTIVHFLKHYQKCLFYKLKDIKSLKNNKIICFKHDINQSEFLDIMNTVIFSDYYKTLILVPKRLKMPKLPIQYTLILYPIGYLDFNKIMLTIFYQTPKSYKNLYLNVGSILINKKNNKKIFMTETEMKILSMLFDKKIVNKDLLRQSILHFQPSVATKSLESHFSRIRKKIDEINGEVSIVSKNSLLIEIQ